MNCKYCKKDISALYTFTRKRYCSERCEKRATNDLLPKDFKDLFGMK